MAIKKWLKTMNNKGNFAIIVAISLTVLIGILAIVIDGGYLYASKNKYQNGVEAAAMAGALAMCDDNFEAVARQIAEENGMPSTAEEGLTVQVGYYDDGNLYDDFSLYKDFEADPDPDTNLNDAVSTEEDPVYNNAVMVLLNGDVSTFLAGIFGKDKVQVSATAVAYLERFLMVSLNENEEIPGITTNCGFYAWRGEIPKLKNGFLYSNTDIEFQTSSSYNGPVFINSHAYAHGTVTPEYLGTSDMEKINVNPIDWDELREKAEENGKIIDDVFFQNLPEENNNTYYGQDEWGNCYISQKGRNWYGFWPHSGDHHGRTYFFDISEEILHMDSIAPDCGVLAKYSVSGCTIAVLDHGIQFDSDQIYWGGAENDKIVKFYTGDKMDLGPISSDFGNEFIGTLFISEGDFGFRNSSGASIDYPIRKIRVIAWGQIQIASGFSNFVPLEEYGFDANFGSPCPPIRTHLGRLEPAGGG